MIKLDVREYCQCCLEFEPVVIERPSFLLDSDIPCGCIGDTIVKCENHDKCKILYNHLKKENEK